MPNENELTLGEKWIMDKVVSLGDLQKASDAKMDKRFKDLNDKIDNNFVTQAEFGTYKKMFWLVVGGVVALGLDKLSQWLP